MSKIAITPNASGTGTVTITSPNTNTDRTLVLPDATGTVNISGSANEVPAGSAGAPAIYPTGDTNTGIFFPSADTVAISTGGTQRLTVDASGNLSVTGTVDATTLSIGGTAITSTAAELNFVDGVTSAIQTQLDAKAPLASPALTGTPTAPTASVGTNTTQIATTAFVIANAGSLDSPAFTGTPTAPTASVGTNTTQLATTAFVNAEIANDAPTKTGGGASGTWSINVTGSSGSTTGNAATVTNGVYTTSNVLIPKGTISGDAGADATTGVGLYQVSMPGYSDLMVQLGGVGGSTPSIQLRANYGDSFWIRASRDSETQWDGVGSRSYQLLHSGNFGGILAGIGAGNVGSYAYCTRAVTETTFTIGSTISGSWLRYSSASGLNSGTPGGTWMCMGWAGGTPNSVNTTTLWLRIS